MEGCESGGASPRRRTRPMLGDRPGEAHGHVAKVTVTLATIRGELSTGQMQAFAPNAIDHRIESGDRGAARMFAAEGVAWVGFHREQGAPESPIARRATQLMRVHANGR